MPRSVRPASTAVKRALSGIDSTSKAILEFLLERTAFAPTAEIASAVGITPRMARYRLQQLERRLSFAGVALEKRPHLGIRIEVVEEMRPLVVKEVRSARHSGFGLEKTTRVEDIACRLLMAEGPVTAKEIAREQGASRATVLKDMRAVEELLRDGGLALERRPNYGFRARGEEPRVREVLVGLTVGRHEERATQILGGGSWRAVPGAKCDQVLAPRVAELLRCLDLSVYDGVASQAQRRLRVRYTDRAFASLVAHIAIQCERVREGHFVEYGPELVESLRGQREFPAAEQMCAAMEKHVGIDMPVEEVAYACIQLACHKTAMPVSSYVLASGATIVDEVSAEAADRMIAIASTYLHPSLKIDGLLQRSLAGHLYATINRLRWGMPIRNPLLEEVRAEHPHVFEVASASVAALEMLVPREVPEDEVGYICMHFAAALHRHLPPRGRRKRVLIVCAEGIATAWLLVSRLATLFPSLEISEIVSARDLATRGSFGDVDGIISTIQLRSLAIPTVVVSPIVTWSDRRRIKEALRLMPKSEVSGHQLDESPGRDLAGLLSVGTLQIGMTASNWRDAVEKACLPLVEDGAIEGRYVAAVQTLIEQFGPFMVLLPGVAVLHAHPDDGVRTSCLAVSTLASPVEFGHEANDPVRILVALGAVDNHSHIQALHELIGVLKRPEMRSRASEATTVSELRAVLLGGASSRQ